MNDFGWNFPGKALFQKFQFSLSKTGNFKVLVRISDIPIATTKTYYFTTASTTTTFSFLFLVEGHCYPKLQKS